VGWSCDRSEESELLIKLAGRNRPYDFDVCGGALERSFRLPPPSPHFFEESRESRS